MVYRVPSGLSESGRACPRCSSALVSQSVGLTTVERCPGCQGLWVPAAEFNELVLDLDRQEAVRQAEAERAVAGEAVQYLRCPHCAATMARTNFARRSGIFVDSCRKHGVWLDHGELRLLVDYLAVPRLSASEFAARTKGASKGGGKPDPKIGQLLGRMPEPVRDLNEVYHPSRSFDPLSALVEIVLKLFQ
jgi:Zn-finger nucleic acid-binding protein